METMVGRSNSLDESTRIVVVRILIQMMRRILLVHARKEKLCFPIDDCSVQLWLCKYMYLFKWCACQMVHVLYNHIVMQRC